MLNLKDGVNQDVKIIADKMKLKKLRPYLEI
jgi:hypothetical protein